MEYISLYRKFRPLKFNEIVGQDHITQTIKNEIMADRVGHAYLFNGGRGTGKTSAAKILARAVNCLNPQDGEPCNECEICKGALAGTLTDIVEMDAASNNSVEDVRAIRDEVSFLPTVAKYRVYIIDEVHMLSTGAFNALLKTLEEPPEHVKFILATTEPQKIPATILSRCQRFDFKKISEPDIVKRLKFVCDESKIDITQEAMNTIAILAEGAMRDALSILERCTQEQTQITADMVKDLVGIPQTESVANLTQCMISGDTKSALNQINDVLNAGKDIENFLWEITKYIKDILICKTKGDLKLYSESEKKRMADLADKTSEEWIIGAIYELSNLSNQIKWSSQKKVIFEVSIIKLCTNTIGKSHIGDKMSENNGDGLNLSDNYIQELAGKIEKLEQKLNNVELSIKVDYPKSKTEKIEQNNKDMKSSMPEKKTPIVLVGKKLENWKEILEQIKKSGKITVYTNLINSEATVVNDMTIGITFPRGLTKFGKSILEQTENMNEIVKQASIGVGKTMRVKLIETEEDVKKLNGKQTSSEEASLKELGVPINFIEE